jgi:hypothetical protein
VRSRDVRRLRKRKRCLGLASHTSEFKSMANQREENEGRKDEAGEVDTDRVMTKHPEDPGMTFQFWVVSAWTCDKTSPTVRK